MVLSGIDYSKTIEELVSKVRDQAYLEGFIAGSEATGIQAEEIAAINEDKVRRETRNKFEVLLADEMLMARKEGQETSRLTSLGVKFLELIKGEVK